MGCPNIEQLEELVEGRLPRDECDSLAEHLDVCAACRETCQTLIDTLCGDSAVASILDHLKSEQTGAEGEELRRAIAALKSRPYDVPADDDPNDGEFRLDFLEPIEAALSYFTLIGADEAVVLRADGAQSCTGKICRFAVEPLKAGKYRIDYHILSADGHVVEGKIGFTVKADQ